MSEERNIGQEFRKAVEFLMGVSNKTYLIADELVERYNKLKETDKRRYFLLTKEWIDGAKSVNEVRESLGDTLCADFKKNYKKPLPYFPLVQGDKYPYYSHGRNHEMFQRYVKNISDKNNKNLKPIENKQLIDFNIFFNDSLHGEIFYDRQPTTPFIKVNLVKKQQTKPTIEMARSLDSEIIINKLDFEYSQEIYDTDGDSNKIGSHVNLTGSFKTRDDNTTLSVKYTVSSDENYLKKEMNIPEESLKKLEDRINILASFAEGSKN